jgi:hypothetical protein
MIKRMIKCIRQRIDAKASKGVPGLTDGKAHPTENRMPTAPTFAPQGGSALGFGSCSSRVHPEEVITAHRCRVQVRGERVASQ